MFRQFVPLANLFGDAVQQIIDGYSGEANSLARDHLKILAHLFPNVQLDIDAARFLPEEIGRHGENDGSATVKFLVLAVGASIRTAIVSVRRQRYPILVQHAEHDDSFFQDDFVKRRGPRDKQLLLQSN